MNFSQEAEERRSGAEKKVETVLQSRLSFLLRSSAPLLLCLLALAVRVIGLTWGLPDQNRWYSYHPDESAHQIVGAVVSLLQGDFNPHFFNYPSLSIYATWFIYQILAGFGLLTNAVSPQYPWPVVRDVILAGRLFSVLTGALTAPLVFLLARRLGMGKWAILAGILMALAPGHVQHSHFATVDVPATFFVTLCLYLTIRAQNWRGLLGAALVAGLAAGTKYNAGLVLFAPLLRAFLPSFTPSGAFVNPSTRPPEGVDATSSTPSGSGIYPSRKAHQPLEEGTSTPQGDSHDPLRESTLPLEEVTSRGRGRGLLGLTGAQIALSLLGFLVSTPFALLAPREWWGNGLSGGQDGFAYEALVHPKFGSGDLFEGTGNGWWYHFSFNWPFLMTWPLVVGALIGMSFCLKKRDWWPILAFVSVFFLVLGLSQVRYLRYLLPLVPPSCLMAALGAARLRFPRVWGAVLAGFAVVGCCNVLFPFIQTDPRDYDIALGQRLLQSNHKIVLLTRPWFYTPPFQPQGFNVPVAGIENVGINIAKVRALAAPGSELLLVTSEFEWREAVRLHPDGPVARFLKQLDALGAKKLIRKNRVPFALPGRDFVPHDYLYTNPETRLYLVKR